MARLTIKCRECKNIYRVEKIEPTQTIPNVLGYCPGCGSQNVLAGQDHERDYWEALAKEYKLPVDLMKQVYELWDPRDHQHFGDFVRELEAEIHNEPAGSVPTTDGPGTNRETNGEDQAEQLLGVDRAEG